MRTVVVTARSFSTGTLDLDARLRSAGIDTVRGPATHDLDTLRESLAVADGWIAGTGPVSKTHLAAAPRLQIVARYGVGVDAVDLDAATSRGVIVTNTPGANAEAVADHTMALTLAALRRVVVGDRRLRAGDWSVDRAREVSALTFGLIGAGRVGRAVARRLRGFDAPVLGIDPWLDDQALRALGIEPAGDRIPREVDVVSLHAPGPDRIIDGQWLSRVRPGLILVNTARASLVDEESVAQALRDGLLGAYAADTIVGEGHSGTSPLLAPEVADRVTLTPHSAAQTFEAVDRMGAMAADAVIDVFAGRRPTHTVTKGAP